MISASLVSGNWMFTYERCSAKAWWPTWTYHDILAAGRGRILVAHLEKQILCGNALLVVHFISKLGREREMPIEQRRWVRVSVLRLGSAIHLICYFSSTFRHFINVPNIFGIDRRRFFEHKAWHSSSTLSRSAYFSPELHWYLRSSWRCFVLEKGHSPVLNAHWCSSSARKSRG